MTLFRQNSDADYHSGTSKIIKWHFFGKTVTGLSKWHFKNHQMTLFLQNSDMDYQSGTSKLQQKFNNKQNIQEKNEIDHNFNIELSILNIKNLQYQFFLIKLMVVV